jgi:type I restriction-modification system DNA methylase subunit
MAASSSLKETLSGISSRIGDDMQEKDVENAFLNEGFYSQLGYRGAGYDLRSEFTLPDNKRPDYVTLDENESVTAVYEFKTSGRDLSPHEDQLFHYVDELKADYGVLTNGDEIRLYQGDTHSRMLAISSQDAPQSEVADLVSALEKPEWDISSPPSVDRFLNNLDEVELDGELGREHFFDTFRLEEGSPFANLVTSMMDLLVELRDERGAKFVEGAYDFWEASYASEPEEVPNSWESFIGGKQSLRDFMFCLESGHALLSRLLLAKATDDYDFFPSERGLRRYFDELGGFGGSIDLDAYPIAANGMIEDMRNQLVQSLFEDDIFIWWIDGYGEQTASQHKSPYSRFTSVAKEGSDVTRVSRSTRERFSRAIAQVSFAVLKFDFSRIEGDPLGDLYQRYFDPETRKALGEFYTPQPVVDYIMEGVEYDVGVSQERLIDPACGSGTFLVEAVERYLDDVRRYDDDPDWSTAIKELCTRPHIVGLDIHPFAVLMAQIRFMVAILPEYKQAKKQDSDFTIRRLPIFRTDSLRDERRLAGVDLTDGPSQMTFDTITEDNEDVKIPVPLPIEVDESEVDEIEDGFLVQRVRMPKYNTARVEASLRNFGEYFAALQGVLDVVKYHMSEGLWTYHGGLEEGINRYTTREYSGTEEFFEPYVDDILTTVRYLREDHGDGRLFKMFEDSVLSLVVKNYIQYDYVVGNPPYVRQENIPQKTKTMLEELYPDIYSGRGDLSIYFLRRSVRLLSESGNVGLIVPNKFTKLGYGEDTREYLSESVEIKDVLDFADADVFEDATTYAMIMITEKKTPREDNQFSTCVIDSSIKELDDPVSYVFEHIGETTDYIWSFDVRQSRIGSEEWRFIPENIHQISDKIRNNATHQVDDVGTVVMGMRPGMNDAFIIEDKIAEEHDIEQGVLRECIKGKDVEPFHLPLTDRKVIYTPEVDPDKHQNALGFISRFEGELRDREQFKSRDDMEWWEIEQPVSAEIFDRKKIISPSFSKRNSFAYDDRGVAHVDTVMSVLLDEYYDDEETRYHVLAILNSRPVEIIFKQSASVYQQRYYRYYQQHIEPLPLVIPDDLEEYSVAEKTKQIVEANRLGDKGENFPNSYLDDYDSDLGYIDYEWQTRRYPVNADIQELADGRFAVTAGRSDEITDPLIDQGDREERKLRAQYVHTAVDGRNMKSGEEQSIPIPRSREGVEQLLDSLEEDRKRVRETNIEELEAQIDEIVYDLFDLTQEEREVIEDYLEVF